MQRHSLHFFCLLLFLQFSMNTVFAQDCPIETSGIIHKGVSLRFKIDKVRFRKSESISIQYYVENKGTKPIYLVIDPSNPRGYEPNLRVISVILEQSFGSDHYFDFPNLKRIVPRGIFHGHVNVDLAFLESNFKLGRWYLDLSIGYFDDKRMTEMRRILKRTPQSTVYGHFQRLQIRLEAGPIQIELVE